MSAQNLATAIVSAVRVRILDSIADMPEGQPHDPWDELEGGVGWLENELEPDVHVYCCEFPWNHLHSVPDVEAALARLPRLALIHILASIEDEEALE